MDQIYADGRKASSMDQICTLWTKIAFMDEKRRFMDQICTLWTRFALMDKKFIFYEGKIPAFLNNLKRINHYYDNFIALEYKENKQEI